MRHPFPRRREITLRGTDETSGSFFSYVDLVDRIPAGIPLAGSGRWSTTRWPVSTPISEPLRPLRSLLDCPGVADPGQLAPDPLFGPLRWQLMEQMQYNLLFRWFAGLSIDDPVWVLTVFTKNRDGC